MQSPRWLFQRGLNTLCLFLTIAATTVGGARPSSSRPLRRCKRPLCPHCGSDRLERLLSRVTIVRGGGASDDAAGDDDFGGMAAAMEGLESGDPRSLARMARQMSEEMGEDLPGEYEPMLRRMEAGEMPEDDEFEDAGADLDDSGDALDDE